jgi:DNA (cytosine-5)-methyltransferase 1
MPTRTITHGSLCSGGVDGMAEGARREGIETIWNCEIDPFARKLLKQEYPNAKQYTDVTKDVPEERPDIISITSECQDISLANGSAVGVMGTRSIILFDCIRICNVLKPDFIVLENSAAILTRGWEYVLRELSEIGYNAEWQCIPLTAFNVQQRRQRLYCIAYSEKIRLERIGEETVFKQSLLLSQQFARVSPGWRDRSCIPEPRTIRAANGFANYKDRIKVLGNMVHPRAAQYLFKCIKLFYQ